jgi:hypothetical protein
MSEIHFIVEESSQGGFIARAVGSAIFAESETTGICQCI